MVQCVSNVLHFLCAHFWCCTFSCGITTVLIVKVTRPSLTRKRGEGPGDEDKYSVDVAMMVEGMAKYYSCNVVSVY